jgi:hypothetical protein
MNTTGLDSPPHVHLGPLPFRISLLITLGTLCWASNLQVCQRLGVEAVALLGLPIESRGRLTTWNSVYRLAFTLAAWCTFNWVLIGIFGFDAPRQENIKKYLPFISLVGILAALIAPVDLFHRRERQSFIRYVNINNVSR